MKKSFKLLKYFDFNLIRMSKLFLIILISTIFFITCDDEDITERDDNQITSYKSTKLNSVKNKGDNLDQLYIVEEIVTNNEDFNKNFMVGLVAEVNVTDLKVSFTKEGEEGVLTYNLVKKDNIYVMELVNKNSYVQKNENLNKEVPKWICGAACVSVGFAWSLLDGPAPLMDLAAIMYTIQCSQDC
jgi:hypothetical protein